MKKKQLLVTTETHSKIMQYKAKEQLKSADDAINKLIQQGEKTIWQPQ